MPQSIAFIGAGISSITAIERLRSDGYDGEILLFGDEERAPYERPPLSKEVLAGENPDGVELRRPQFYADNAVHLQLGTTIVEIEPGPGALTTRDGHRFEPDTTVLATGGSARRLHLCGTYLRGIHVLRTHEDAVALRDDLLPGARIAVVGGGFIGTEVASVAATRGLDTVLLEAQAAPLAEVLPALSPYIAEYHRRRGVRLRTEAVVESFTGTDRVTGVRLATGEVIPADVVVVGVGMKPNDALAADAGLPTGNGVHVDHCLATPAEHVYAIGDVAAVEGRPGARKRIEHWQNAIHHGERLAAHLLDQDPLPTAVPWFWSDQFDLNIQMVGEPSGADRQVWRGDPEAAACTVLFHRDDRVTGAISLNSGRDIRPASDLIRAGCVINPDALADPDVDLRKFARSMTRI